LRTGYSQSDSYAQLPQTFLKLMDMHACNFVFTSFFTLHCIVKTGVKAHSLWSVAPQLLLVPISTAPAQRSVD
jgi:hypothetical protein